MNVNLYAKDDNLTQRRLNAGQQEERSIRQRETRLLNMSRYMSFGPIRMAANGLGGVCRQRFDSVTVQFEPRWEEMMVDRQVE